ncbi:MAG: YdeI/OmpD-associated family protein [Verrucomicrobiota bacterium]|nr:MAG: YdeI/OmpD-associated family protein [Verrucomicrobiota bacterium]
MPNDRNQMPQNVLFLRDRQEFRRWLTEHHNSALECWVSVKRGFPKDEANLGYLDALEEALCFGWIDSVVKKFSEFGVLQRMLPRRPRSQWSELNKERCRRLEKLGRMRPAGRAALPDLSNCFVIDEDVLDALKQDPIIWRNFQNFPPLYQRVRIDVIQRVKKQKPLFEARLARFLEKTRQNILYGEWNDRGRLLEY